MICKKEIFLSILAVFLVSSSAKAFNDIFEEIGKGLEKPVTIKEKKSYFVNPLTKIFGVGINLFKAMINKDSYILYKELYLSSRYSFGLEQIGGRNSTGFILFGTFLTC